MCNQSGGCTRSRIITKQGQIQSSHMASAVYQILASIATPTTVDSHHKTMAKGFFTPQLETKTDAFTAARAHSPCFTAGSTGKTIEVRMSVNLIDINHAAWRKHGAANVYNSTYGAHYRNTEGEIDPCNVLILGRAGNSTLHAIEDVLREKLRANPAQSKQQARVTDSGHQVDPEGVGTIYILAAPDGPRNAFLEADAKHKVFMALRKWCLDPKNKSKGEDDY